MLYLITKYAVTAFLVVMISEIAKRTAKTGAIISAMPVMTILVLIWLYVEKQPVTKISSYASYTFWYVIPTLPLFLIFPFLLKKISFWWSLSLSLSITAAIFFVFALIMRKAGLNLL